MPLLPSAPDGRRAALPVSLIADDYGLGDAVDAAILELCRTGRIAGFSCMTTPRRWPRAAAAISDLPSGISVGLHLVLTALPSGCPVDGPPPPAAHPLGLLARVLLGGIDEAAVAAQFDAQLDSFEAAIGRPPDHVDGHHHVHAMPGIARVVGERLVRRYGTAAPWIRVCAPALTPRGSLAARARRAIISGIGQRQSAALAGFGLSGNAAFGGVRSFAPQEDFGAVLDEALRSVDRPGTLVMCHPARPGSPVEGDEIAAARIDEYSVLAGDGLPRLLERHGLALGPLSPAPVARPAMRSRR